MTGRKIAPWLATLAIAALAACAPTGERSSPPDPQEVSLDTLPTPDLEHTDPALASDILSQVNDLRTEKGKAPLGVSSDLNRIAMIHSADMLERNFVGHYNPEGQGVKERVTVLRPSFSGLAGENIAIVTPEPGETPQALATRIVADWRKNPLHRKLMVDAAYSQTGMGVAVFENKVAVTQVFASP